MSKLSIFLADDHAVVREGLKRLIDSEEDMEVVGEAEDGEEAVTKAVKMKPHIVVMDVSMPGTGGAQATRTLKESAPEIKVIALTVHEDRGYIQELLEAGAAGYILKRAASEELIRAIRSVSIGGIYVDQRLVSNLLSSIIHPRNEALAPIEKLSEREMSVLRLIASGYTNKEIAAQLDVSVKTVETYKARSMEKLSLRSRVDIVRVAKEQGWFQTKE
jgi:two-component system, NarL family, response regulator NreC